ncbi:hypothetical protein ZWY2020_053102 [Hordeum vulgare]|nr:hypothetical protein ZWY2020_053102 [Hordeum vulgare]
MVEVAPVDQGKKEEEQFSTGPLSILMLGVKNNTQIADKILNKKELEFYKWEVLQRIHARQWTNEKTILEQGLLSATSFHVWTRLQPAKP